jgi:Domain of unknown function (DUF4158)
MTTRVFSDEDLERLRSFPEINREELIRFFTLTSADVEFIDPGRGRGPSDRLGLAVQLCTLPWLARRVASLEPLLAGAGFGQIHTGEAVPWLRYGLAVKTASAA